jgi:hypothetical protein
MQAKKMKKYLLYANNAFYSTTKWQMHYGTGMPLY